MQTAVPNTDAVEGVAECTCAFHASGELGHAPTQKAFEVVSECPNCHERDVLRLCQGRVLALLGSLEADRVWVDCPICRTAGPAKAFWRAVGTLSGTPSENLACRPDRRCVGC